MASRTRWIGRTTKKRVRTRAFQFSCKVAGTPNALIALLVATAPSNGQMSPLKAAALVAFLVVSTLLHGLLVGEMLAGPATAPRPVVSRGAAAVAAGFCFFVEQIVVTGVTGGPAFLGLAVVGAPVVAVITAKGADWITEPVPPAPRWGVPGGGTWPSAGG
ncbi:hypothetical protein ACIBCA_36255 [Kitasatospora sp. NPDC051170]|uniref:hypothetical protein n=1 Tax=Kitasatospora sp. NPDC051170 TaxID=3364056 RepID=UPI0037ADAE6F